MAACCARTASKAADHRISGHDHAVGVGRLPSAFVQRLRELGWIEGRTVAIEYRWAEGRNDRFNEIAAEFARLKVDIIVTSGGAGVAAKQATSTIPIVLALANDPVGSGLAASLARPRRQRHRPVAACSRSCRQAARRFTPASARCSP